MVSSNYTYWVYWFLLVLIILIIHYGITLASFSVQAQKKGKRKDPPLAPYFMPLLGDIPWTYLMNPLKFFSTSRYFARAEIPVRAKVLTKDLYIVQGTEHVHSLLGNNTTSNSIFNSSFLRYACKMSAHGVSRFDSPDEVTPNFHERKNYLDATPLYSWSSAAIHTYLTGRSALHLSRRFETHLRCRLQKYDAAGPDGVLLDDFLDLFVDEVVLAQLDAMCGTGLVQRNPGFPKTFWTFCDNLQTFMKRTPPIFAKKAYKAQEEAIAGVKNWQMWASEHFNDTTSLDENGDDQFWGSKFFRERYSEFVFGLGFDPADVAAMELGFLLGASSNVTMSTYWCVVDVFKDKALLDDIRKEVGVCKVGDGDTLQFDVSKLLQQPILQAVFSESLRLRCHNMFIRKTKEDIELKDWLIPGNNYAIAWSTPGHMDPKVWCDGDGSHPVDTFWPGRFLERVGEGKSLRFSLQGREGSWIPFGSGANICPGRNFAKIHAILTVAMMVESFDCDILANSKSMKLKLSKYGIGVLDPEKNIPARLRRRAK
ncbi:cytochrome P450 [Corynespora cassiicola Philippines]|uniref:Cytochrome P450 n=1 Tax=Corynespora cassiicola Philippines TaxID=1448308 RepID=A0A2T2NDU4_CORCC|nr:cytochrome P450 [Corynespora cassiicola Philippines]